MTAQSDRSTGVGMTNIEAARKKKDIVEKEKEKEPESKIEEKKEAQVGNNGTPGNGTGNETGNVNSGLQRPDLKIKINKGKFHFVPDGHVLANVYTLFDVEKELGRGASCRVLRVSRKSDKKLMAMKEMKRDDRWNPMLFEQEVFMLQKLAGTQTYYINIQHIILLNNTDNSYEDCYMDDKNFYVCTTLCTGGELFAFFCLLNDKHKKKKKKKTVVQHNQM
ncbi:hypothetical protein RFI_18560 [Reticulomyxa filosa]|uniref:Protein kinase domain-containing protein n=1 Tax=Reticulomyxa filosa TaxID=46433 RepID=X6MXD6_RETFI|nr:hypothetical protein RFI_18560 [Reticulomyxa filosa]|eukprot:ETO18690.1 hypothetical protein RFI_18560 [Reticulomyxa filosa]